MTGEGGASEVWTEADVDELAYWLSGEDCTDDLPDDTPESAWLRMTQAALDAACIDATTEQVAAAALTNRRGSDERWGCERRARAILDHIGADR